MFCAIASNPHGQTLEIRYIKAFAEGLQSVTVHALQHFLLTKTCLLYHIRYDEVCKPGYSFSNGGFSSGTGHFTQVVWKDSIKLGIGQGKATQNGMPCIYVVGRYEIAGNMMGEFQDQVLRGNFNEDYCNNVKK